MIPDRLETARLLLRPFAESDARSVFEYWQSDPAWERYNASVPENFSLSGAKVFLHTVLQRDRDVSPSWAIVHQGKVVGIVSLTLEQGNRIATIGYGVHNEVRGRGVAIEAASTVISGAFRHYDDLRKIRALTDAENHPSHRVLQKLGFSQEGTLRQNQFAKHRFVDEAVFGLLREDWEAGAKRICICGSMTFIDDMETLANDLRRMGFRADAPVREQQGFDWSELAEDQALSRKRAYIDGHLSTIRRSNLVLIANYAKYGIQGYIGANTLMEAAFAHALGIRIAYLNPVDEQPCRLEALALSRKVIGDDLGALNAIAGWGGAFSGADVDL